MDSKIQFATEDHAKIYRSYRRDTPISLIEHVISSLKEKYDGPLELAVDVGCGSGQSITNLAPFFNKVHGIDVSEAQIREAKANRALPNVTYETGPAETLPFSDETVQLVTAGAALHWFELEAFFPEVRRVLCNNGILAVYCSSTMKPFLDDPARAEEVDKLWEEFYTLVFKHFAPQANLAVGLYKDIVFPFEEVLRLDNVRDNFDGELRDIIGYMSSMSGFQNFKRQGDGKAEEHLSEVEERFRKIITESKLNADGPLKLYRDFNLVICRKMVTDA